MWFSLPFECSHFFRSLVQCFAKLIDGISVAHLPDECVLGTTPALKVSSSSVGSNKYCCCANRHSVWPGRPFTICARPFRCDHPGRLLNVSAGSRSGKPRLRVNITRSSSFVDVARIDLNAPISPSTFLNPLLTNSARHHVRWNPAGENCQAPRVT